jgi:hypothetical protein
VVEHLSRPEEIGPQQGVLGAHSVLAGKAREEEDEEAEKALNEELDWEHEARKLIGEIFQTVMAHAATRGGSDSFYMSVLESVKAGISLSSSTRGMAARKVAHQLMEAVTHAEEKPQIEVPSYIR